MTDKFRNYTCEQYMQCFYEFQILDILFKTASSPKNDNFISRSVRGVESNGEGPRSIR